MIASVSLSLKDGERIIPPECEIYTEYITYKKCLNSPIEALFGRLTAA
jgi:hypothetical protein